MGGPVIAVALPFENLPTWAAALFYAVFVLIIATLVWTVILFAVSRRALNRAPEPDPEAVDRFLWIFLVPALDEELTIADSVKRLLAVKATNKAVIVIDDGSTDGTADVLAGIEDPQVEVLRRVSRDARLGKAAALNDAWRHIDHVLESPRWAGWPRDRVLVVVVDADGRLDPEAPAYVAARFADPETGGLQVLVRIYNRSRLLTWFQDVEFAIYGLLYGAARTVPGTAGMGGNGQFQRLPALDDIADADSGGPWRDRLTEDQDLGLRLIEAGWNGVAEHRTTVEQQGLPGLRRLLRQWTRWAQGNLQAMSQLRAVWRADKSFPARLDLVCYLLQPVVLALVGVAFITSIFLAIFDVADYWSDDGWWQLLFFFLLGYGGIAIGCIARGARSGLLGIVKSLAIVPLYAAYTWLIWPALLRAALRMLLGRRTWAKTDPEALEDQHLATPS